MLLAGSIGLSIILCAPVLNAPLVSDDWVLLDALVRKGIWGAWGGGGHEMLGFFRPLMTLTLWVNLKIGGLNPLGYHLVNAVIHGIAAWLVLIVVWLLLVRLGRETRNSAIMILGAWLLFLVHPSHGEPVAWVSSRPDLMACALALGALAMWISASGRPASGSLRRGLAGLLFVLALLAKESAIVLPLIILAYEFILGSSGSVGSRIPRALRRTWPLFLILILFLIVRAAALGHAVGGYGSGRILAINPVFWARNLAAATIRSALPAIASPGSKIIYPAIVLLFAAGVLAALAYQVIKMRSHGVKGPHRAPVIAFCLAAFLISLAPIINLPLSIRSSEGERFIYLASAFMAMAMAIGIGTILRRSCNSILCAIVCLYFVGMAHSLGVWREAGAIAGSIVHQVQSGTRMKGIEWIEVTNLPDHYRGAYVFRNGFAEALRLNGISKEQVPEIKIKSLHPILTAEDKTIMSITIKMPPHEGEVYRTRLPRDKE